LKGEGKGGNFNSKEEEGCTRLAKVEGKIRLRFRFSGKVSSRRIPTRPDCSQSPEERGGGRKEKIFLDQKKRRGLKQAKEVSESRESERPWFHPLTRGKKGSPLTKWWTFRIAREERKKRPVPLIRGQARSTGRKKKNGDMKRGGNEYCTRHKGSFSMLLWGTEKR